MGIPGSEIDPGVATCDICGKKISVSINVPDLSTDTETS